MAGGVSFYRRVGAVTTTVSDDEQGQQAQQALDERDVTATQRRCARRPMVALWSTALDAGFAVYGGELSRRGTR